MPVIAVVPTTGGQEQLPSQISMFDVAAVGSGSQTSATSSVKQPFAKLYEVMTLLPLLQLKEKVQE